MSGTVLRKVDWQGFDAWCMEDASLKIVVVPETGGRIVSLFDKSAGYEWLVSPEQSHPFRRLAYGTAFDPNNAGGWDEMMPTIVTTPYPGPGARKGQPLPDHGEVWTLAWSDAGSSDEQISLSVAGQALPYRLTRTIAGSGARELTFTYVVENLSSEMLAYLWAAHPQFACEPGATILLPPEVSEVINVLPLEWGPEWGPLGTHNAWPAIQTPEGTTLRQDLVRGPETHVGRKFYLPPDQPIAWAGLQQPKAGCSLRMEWDAATLPYCGVWIDEGWLNQVSDVAIEPTTGYYDNLSLAWDNDRVTRLAPGARASWQLRVRLL